MKVWNWIFPQEETEDLGTLIELIWVLAALLGILFFLVAL